MMCLLPPGLGGNHSRQRDMEGAVSFGSRTPLGSGLLPTLGMGTFNVNAKGKGSSASLHARLPSGTGPRWFSVTLSKEKRKTHYRDVVEAPNPLQMSQGRMGVNSYELGPGLSSNPHEKKMYPK